jgi:hypothetical protein
MFKSASIVVREEKALRAGIKDKLLKFGISYLDDAFRGIFPSDVVLVGAASGLGKTQFCVNVALHNLEQEKRVHFFALEAEYAEIERRLKFSYVANYYFSDPNRPRLDRPLNFSNWLLNDCGDALVPYDTLAEDYCAGAFKNLFTFYKADKFDLRTLNSKILEIENETDLIILDHLHYFDWEDENDNRALKEIVKLVRDLALENGKPVILVAHLRKRDRGNKDLVPGMEEFQGSSDLFKIATKVITLAPGGPTPDKKFITYFRAPKNRLEGSVNRYVGQMVFDPKKGTYEPGYQIGFSNSESFNELDALQWPDWAVSCRNSIPNNFLFEGNRPSPHAARPKNHAPMFNPGGRD